MVVVTMMLLVHDLQPHDESRSQSIDSTSVCGVSVIYRTSGWLLAFNQSISQSVRI